MNEEQLKVVISATTDQLKKGLDEGKKALSKFSKNVKKEFAEAKKSADKELSGISSSVKSKLGGIKNIIAGAGIGAAIASAFSFSKEYTEEMAKLNSAFQATGKSSAQAAETYGKLYRFLGETDQAVETANHLAKISSNEQDLAEWAKICQGVYASFGDSLPVENLAEAANETIRTGKVVGSLADALNWAGASEDQFNAQLAECTSLSEREALVRSTLIDLHGEAADIYERNNAALLANRDAQESFNRALNSVGQALTPLITSLYNVGAALLNVLAPALNAVVPIISTFVNAIATAVNWVSSLFSILGGGGGAATSAVSQISAGMGSAAAGAEKLASSVGGVAGGASKAAKEVEKLKKTTEGFDELIIMPEAQSADSSGGGSGGAAAGGGGGVTNDLGLDNATFNESLNQNAASAEAFAAKIREVFGSLKEVFAPTIEAWSGAFATIGEGWNLAKDNFLNGLTSIKDGFASIGLYLLEEFIPTVVNSFSENLAPYFGDVLGWGIQNLGLTFEWLGGLIQSICVDIIQPTLENLQMVATGIFDAIGTAWEEHGQGLLEGVSGVWDSIRDVIQDFYDNLVVPIWTKIQGVLKEVWEEGLQPLVEQVADSAGSIGEELLTLYNEVIYPVVDWILNNIYPVIVDVVSKVLDVAGGLLISISGVIDGVVEVIEGIVTFITGVFTGDWEKAWEGVKKIFNGIWQALKSIIKPPVNGIIGAINGLIGGIVSGINGMIGAINNIRVTIPDWVPIFGGSTFGVTLPKVTAPKIPLLAEGGIATGATLAMIGERGKEAVLPLENNTGWMDTLADKIANRNSSPSKIVLMLDGKELGWASINSINNITRQTGTVQLAMA